MGQMPRYAAMTMVHREAVYLDLWIRHYQAIVGRENLYILVHGGDPAIMAMAEGCRLIYLPRFEVTAAFDRDRFALLNAYADFLLTQYDGIVAGDVDELVFVDPALGLGLFEFAEQHRDRSPVLKTFCLNLVEVEGDAPFDPAQPVFAQRRLARVNDEFCKPLIALQSPKWSAGYHTSAHPPYLPDGLYMAHLHYMSQHVYKAVAEARIETLEANPQIREGHSFKADWWSKGARHNRVYNANSGNLPRINFDQHIAELVDSLRGNEVKSRFGRRITTYSFGDRPQIVLDLPERFAQVI